MPALEAAQIKWIELFDEFCRDGKLKNEIAGLFFSVPAVAARSILYVGKATAKDWYKDNSYGRATSVSNKEDMKERIEGRRECTTSSKGFLGLRERRQVRPPTTHQ